MRPNQPWIRKYAPDRINSIIGQDEAIKDLKDVIKKKGFALLYGPSGIGKTISAHAIANELDYEILELNASDFRKKDQINSIIGNSIKQRSLFGKEKLILIDEVDGISGKKDFGGIAALVKILDISPYPIILTATDPFDKKFNAIRKKCQMIEFADLSYSYIFLVLKNIAKSEKIKYEEFDLKSLSRMTGGDLRAAINDFQSLVSSDGELRKEDLEILSQRDQSESIKEALVRVFKTKKLDIALGAFNNVDENLEKSLLWIEENLPKEYEKPKDLAKAYDWLSKADIFLRRIRRRQEWRFLVYVNAFLTGGIATAKEEKYHKSVDYKQTSRLLKIWMANRKFAKRKDIVQKIAGATHVSYRRALHDTFPYFHYIFKKNNTESEILAENLELSPDEIAWLRK